MLKVETGGVTTSGPVANCAKTLPRGGPMTSGHQSHQLGLDIDVWMLPPASLKLSRAEPGKPVSPATNPAASASPLPDTLTGARSIRTSRSPG